jgi:hypothetical protein
MATWKITIDGQVFYEHDLSIGDANWVCDQVGEKTWRAVHPLLGGPQHARAVFAALLARHKQISREDALALADEVSLGALQSFAPADDDRPGTHAGGLPEDPPKAETSTG